MTAQKLTQTISISELQNIAANALEVLGLTKPEQQIVLDILMYAELRGKSQGLVKILEKTIVPAVDRTAVGLSQRSPCIAALEANGNIGMVVLQQAADKAVELCASYGMALVTTSGSCTSTGSIGYYAERMAQRGYLGIVLAGSPKVMALHGSRHASMGTNPVAAGIPTLQDPLVIDMATSAITVFEMIKMARDGGQLPTALAYDSSGQPTLSPAAALEGVLTTFAGAKGSALALLFECLTGPMTGSSIVGDEPDNRGNFVIAIDPDLVLDGMAETGSFAQRTSTMLQRMRTGAQAMSDAAGNADSNSNMASSEQANGGLRLPGDSSAAKLAAALASGELEVSSSILQGLREIAQG